MKLIYLTLEDVSVYESQILELLKYLNTYMETVLIQGYKNQKEKNNLQKKLSNYPTIRVVWYKTFPLYHFFERFTVKNIYKALLGELSDTSILHIRGQIAGSFYKKIICKYHLKIPALIDLRAYPMEIDYVLQNAASVSRKFLSILHRQYFIKLNNFLFRRDNFPIIISSVSPEINDYIQINYPACSYKMFFNPNICGTQFEFNQNKRSEIRKKHEIKDDDILAICSTGGNGTWQKDYLIIPQLVNLGIKVIHLSRFDYGLSDCFRLTVPFNEMPDYLSAGDIAVLWREDTPTNTCASPSKFSEFASMGLYVIHNGTVRVATEYILQNNAGLIVDDINNINKSSISKDILGKRQELILKGEKVFSIDTIGKNYIDIYQQLITLY
jgi:hypothetical protein